MVTTNDPFLIADTSGLISLTVRTDANHAPAIEAAKPLRERKSTILVPYEVLVETVNVLGKRLGHDEAASVAYYLYQTTLFLVVDSSRKARQHALERFKTQPRAVSFTDCVVMAIADEYGTKAIFGFDADHARSGYVILSQESRGKGSAS
jgi:predicted nucleic acid-binding protein